jgi:hypothetical protein
MNNSAPSLPKWLNEIVLAFYNEMPRSVAELRLSPNNSPKVFSGEILPSSKNSASILISAEEGDWEATISFGKASQIDARHYDEPDGEAKFKKRVFDICMAISGSCWEERIVMRGERVVKCIATLPEPIGRVTITGWRPFSLSSLHKQTETVIQWEPYSPVK